MEINKIKSQIKKIAKDFNLSYNSKWFNFIWITKRDEIILQYIGNCLDPVYKKYGNRIERIRNINKFFKNDLKKLSKRYGGEVYSLESLKYQIKLLPLIKNKKIRAEISKLLRKINKEIGGNSTALITKTKNKNELKILLKSILRHEWIHILLFHNSLEFGKINNKLWMYDEGLCTYLEAYIDKTTNQLEAKVKARKYPYEKKYFVYAIKFRELFKDGKTPKDKKMRINYFIKKLSIQSIRI